LPGERLEHPVAERELDRKVDLAAAFGKVREAPGVVEVLERTIEVDHLDFVRPLLEHPGGELLAQRLEPDQHVGDHFVLAVRLDPRRHDPRQELTVAAYIGDEIEHLPGGIRQPPDLANARHPRGAAVALHRRADVRSRRRRRPLR
jgi:hypothetical protein